MLSTAKSQEGGELWFFWLKILLLSVLILENYFLDFLQKGY